jgi:hypothetical protein
VNGTDYEPADPRGLTQIQDGLAARGQLVPREAWPFILLAAFAVAANGQLFLSNALPDLLCAGIAAGALLPVAILIGCRDAWRSARLLLLGAIVWTSIPLVGDVVSWAQQVLSPEQWPDVSVFSDLQIARGLADLVSVAGPALVAIALLRSRRTETTWPGALVGPTLVATAMLCLLAANGALSDFSGTTIQVTPGYPWLVAFAALGPLRLLTVGALAWSTLAAARAKEEPRRFWLLVFAGSAVLLGVAILVTALNLAAYSHVLVGFAFPYQPILISLGSLVGMVLLFIAFAQGLPAVVTTAGGHEAVAIPAD